MMNYERLADYEASAGEDQHLKEWTFANNNAYSGLDLPYAVYGTLRPGCGNDVLWEGIGNLGATGFVSNFKMVTGKSRSFPYALPAPHGSIVTELVYPVEGFERVLRDRFDTLEGYPNFYDRKIVKVETVWGFVEAWLYFAPSTTFLGETVNVFCGDWVDYLSSKG